MIGKSTRECPEDGQWTELEPVCESISPNLLSSFQAVVTNRNIVTNCTIV